MEGVPTTAAKQFAPSPSTSRGSMAVNQVLRQQNPGVFSDLSNDQPVEEYSRTQVFYESKFPGFPTVNHQGQDTFAFQRHQVPPPRHPVQPLAEKRNGNKPASGRAKPNRQKGYATASPQPRKKRERGPLKGYLQSPTLPEDCITHLPFGIPFPKKPGGCEIIPQTIEPRSEDRSTIYFTRHGVLGMPLRYMYNLDGMDDGDEPVNLGLDPIKSCQITLVIAWPGYKEATYEILVYTPLYPTAPFVTVYGLRQLTKRELAIETLRCIHRWMIEHPWSGERHEGIPEWKLNGEKSPGISAKMVWLSMISPVGDGRWITQLQKAPGPS